MLRKHAQVCVNEILCNFKLRNAFLKGEKMEKLKKSVRTGTKAKVLLGLYAGFGSFFLILYPAIEGHIRKSAGLYAGDFYFPLIEGIIGGIIFGISVGFAIYKITKYFELKSDCTSTIEKNAVYCGILNFIVVFVISGAFLSYELGPVWGWMLTLFMFSGIVGILGYLNINFRESLKGIKLEGLKIEHEELRLILNSLILATMAFLTGAVVMTAVYYLQKYLPDIPKYVHQTITLYAAQILYFFVGVFWIFSLILGRMGKIRAKIKGMRC